MNSIVSVAGKKSRKLGIISNVFGGESGDSDEECNEINSINSEEMMSSVHCAMSYQ